MLHIEVRKKIVEARKNGLTTGEICKAKMGLSISVVAIHNTIHKKLNYQYKKRQYTPVSVSAQM